ncbi:unnamed protein product [Calypogeia fissa]
MSSGVDSTPRGQGQLRCLLDNVQGLVDALTSVHWKKQQDAVCELSEHGIVITVEEWGCMQARVFFRKELFRNYDYQLQGRSKFGVSLGLLVDSLNTFTSSSGTTALELRYPVDEMQLLLKLIDAHDTCINAWISTRDPDTVPRDYSIEDISAGLTPTSFAVKSAALKDAIEDLEWPGASISLTMCPNPPRVIFKGEGHGDLEIQFLYNAQADLFIAFQCDREVSHKYKYKFLRATTANIPSTILKDNRGSKVTIGSTGLLKVQHLISIRPTQTQQQQVDPNYNPQTQGGRVSYIEFYVLPEVEGDEETSPQH